jgi:hypothetical protein
MGFYSFLRLQVRDGFFANYSKSPVRKLAEDVMKPLKVFIEKSQPLPSNSCTLPVKTLFDCGYDSVMLIFTAVIILS